MKLLLLAGTLWSGLALQAADTKASSPALPPAAARRLEWWREARFGMFIHRGPVSLKGTEISRSRGAPIPIEEYDNLYRRLTSPGSRLQELELLSQERFPSLVTLL